MKSFQWTTIPPALRYALIHDPHTAKTDIPTYIHRAGFDLSPQNPLKTHVLELSPYRWYDCPLQRR